MASHGITVTYGALTANCLPPWMLDGYGSAQNPRTSIATRVTAFPSDRRRVMGLQFSVTCTHWFFHLPPLTDGVLWDSGKPWGSDGCLPSLVILQLWDCRKPQDMQLPTVSLSSPLTEGVLWDFSTLRTPI